MSLWPLPLYIKTRDEIESEFESFKSKLDGEVKALAQKKWNWRERAIQIGMEEEYEFIYMYTSQLMHATPVSRS